MATTIKATRYMGVEIEPVVSCEMAAAGYRCYIQTYHPTGMPYSHDVCAHYRTVKAAKESIREAKRHEARS